MMKKKILSALTALCCAVGCFSLTASAFDLSEIDMGENTTILAETETFVYLSDGRIYTSMIDTYDLFLVTGTYYQENGTEPYYYIFNPIYNGYFGDEVLIYADEVKAQLTEGSAMPQYGDLLDCDYSIIVDTYPTSIGFSASSGCIDNLGASVDVLGTDFQCVVSHNMCTDIIWNDADGNPCEFRINPVLPNEEFVVIGVDNEENPETFIIMSAENTSHVLELPISYVEQFQPEGEDPIEFGDILLLEGSMCCTELANLNTFGFIDVDDIDNDGDTDEDLGYIYNTGSVLDGETAAFTVGETNSDFFCNLGGNYYYIVSSYSVPDLYTQPGCIDLSTVSSGDSVTCITYNGVPVLPVSVTRLGDFNTDGEINAMDATRILMAAAAAGAGTEAVSTASETTVSPVGDVNSDGEVNAMDATIVLVYAARNGAGAQVSVSEVATELME